MSHVNKSNFSRDPSLSSVFFPVHRQQACETLSPRLLTLASSPEWLCNPPPQPAVSISVSARSRPPHSSWPSGQHSCASWRQSSDTSAITYPRPHQLRLLPGIPHIASSSSYRSAFSGPQQNRFHFQLTNCVGKGF